MSFWERNRSLFLKQPVMLDVFDCHMEYFFEDGTLPPEDRCVVKAVLRRMRKIFGIYPTVDQILSFAKQCISYHWGSLLFDAVLQYAEGHISLEISEEQFNELLTEHKQWEQGCTFGPSRLSDQDKVGCEISVCFIRVIKA